MESVLMMILMLSFTAVTTEQQQSGKEIPEPVPFPESPPMFHRVEKIETGKSVESPPVPAVVNNDADIFWEVTKSPRDTEVVDGNHPDNYEITTHEHVDQTIGHVQPTKRVKKILPPFDGKKQARDVRRIQNPKSADSGTTRKTKENLPGEGEATEAPAGEVSSNASAAQKNLPAKDVLTTPVAEEATTSQTQQVLPTGDATPMPSAPPPEEEIQGIRLVPDEFGLLTPSDGRDERDETERGEEGEEEGDEGESAMQKSIWDLLKEREQFNAADPARLDGLENASNETEATTELPGDRSKSLYDHFDADSAEVEFETADFKRGSNIEKHELPISYAMSWLQMKDKGFDVRRKQEAEDAENGSDGGKAAAEVPQDISKLLELVENEKSVNGVTVSVINSGGSDALGYGRRPSKWYLLLLTGNSTIVKLRRKDFAKYLKLNLAARLSVEYDDVKVNKVILAPPRVLVNISVFAPSDDVAEESQLDFKISDKGEAPLYRLAETNATLLELSGEEYHVVRFLSLESQKPEAEAQKDAIPSSVSMASRHDDLEFIVYTFLGSACACALLLTFFVTLNRYFKRVSDLDWPRFRPRQAAWKVHEDSEQDKDEFNGVSPAVIYSGGFPQIRGSWMSGVGATETPAPRRQAPPIELGGSPPRRKATPRYPDPDDRPCSSPRHSKLQIYNCDADSLVIPMPVQSTGTGRTGGKAAKNEGGDTHPLDVRILTEKTGQDNPMFSN